MRRPGPRRPASRRRRRWGRRGEKRRTRRSVFAGSAAASAVGTSSAVPVLPATATPGSAAAVPVPPRTTSSIMPRHLRPRRPRRTTRRRRTSWPRTSRGRARTPSVAIVAPTLAMASGVARSRSWPIALAPTARSSVELARRRDRARLARPGSAGVLVEAEAPRRSARAARAPSRAPSGREDRVARVGERLRQRPAARLVARVAQRDALERRRRPHGERLARPRPRPPAARAASVMILNDEPGGWGPRSRARRARARRPCAAARRRRRPGGRRARPSRPPGARAGSSSAPGGRGPRRPCAMTRLP